MTFRVGQKVVYVSGPAMPNEVYAKGARGLKKGTVYTVRAINELYTPYYGYPGILVAEVVNDLVPYNGGWLEPARLACYFRPVVERKTDIAVFTEILRKATKPARTPLVTSKERT